MSDQQLFDRINLDHRGLDQVKLAVEAGDYESARQVYIDFLRARTLPHYPTPVGLSASYPSSNRRANSNISEKALRNTYTVKNVSHTFTNEINWLFNPTDKDQNPGYQGAFVREWTNQFNRLSIVRQLANDFHGTGNPIYAQKLDELLSHWIENVPKPPGKAKSTSKLIHPWRSLEVGIRVGASFPEAWRRCIQADELTEATVIAWVKSWVQHADYLVSYPGANNFLTTESEGCSSLACFP